MRKGVKKIVIMVLVLWIFLMMGTLEAQTLAPRLLWEKKLPFKIYGMKMAGESGEVLLSSKEARQIILYDKNGNKRFHWGPRIDRQPMGVDISDDGNKMVYTTSWTENYTEKKKINIQKLGWDRRVHYCTRKGKELWNKKIAGVPHLSPDGNLTVISKAAGEGIGLTLLDSNGRILWEHAGDTWISSGIIFSPDSNYIGVAAGGIDRFYLFDKNGTLVLMKAHHYGIYSISEGASYISLYPYNNITQPDISHGGKIYDKQGNIVMDGFGRVSADGKRLILLLNNKIVIYSLPGKLVIKEYIIQGEEAILSSDGKFLVVIGKQSSPPSTNNIFAFNIQENITWETYVGGSPWVYLTKDAKYLLIRSFEENKLFYYQLY